MNFPEPQRPKLSFLTVFVGVVVLAGFILAVVKASGLFEVRTHVKVRSAPPGALVLVDGVPAGLSPLELSDLQPGAHEFRFVLEGYRDAVIAKTCIGDVLVEADMKALPSAELRVESSPPGAKVFVDGVERGTTPATLKLSPGGHTLSLLKENYLEHIEEVTLTTGKALVRKVELTPAVESYYREAIKAAPNELLNYCDLMRYYYVNRRFDDLVNLIFDGLAVLIKKRSNPDEGYRRFIQELGKVRLDDAALYDEEIFPLVFPRLLELWSKDRKLLYLGDYLILSYRNPEKGLPLLVSLLWEHKDRPELYLYAVKRGTKASNLISKLPREKFTKLVSLFLEGAEGADARDAVDMLSGLGNICKRKHDYSSLETVSLEMMKIAEKAGDKKNYLKAALDYVISLRVQRKFDEAEKILASLLAREKLPKAYRNLFQREADRVKRLKKRMEREKKRAAD